MELKWLEDFLALSATGNFRVAAEQRCVSQPAFSRRIQALENWLEAQLIDRSVQPAQLTKAGHLFHPVAQKIVDQAGAGKFEIQTLVREDKERIRFSTLSTLAQVFLPAWLKSLQPFTDASQFAVKTEYDRIADYFAAVESNAVDFFVCYEDPKNKFYQDETVFSSLKLAEEFLVPVISPDAHGAPRWWLPDRPQGAIPCLHTLIQDTPSPIRFHMQSKYSDLTFKSVYESSISPTLKAMAIEGFGLAWIPSAHVADDLKSGRLVRAAEPQDDIFVDINIYRCTKHNEPRVEKFWQALLQS
ncbi:MAG: LysR family transcriptional regulator [Paracoccaceae bacterium]